MFQTGIVSVTFRKKPIDEIIALAASCGQDAIEIGSDVHAPRENLDECRRIAALAAKSGIAIASYGSYYKLGQAGNSDAVFAEYLAAASALGAPNIRIWGGIKGSAAATEEERAKMQRPLISGTTLPGASVSIEFPHENLELDPATGRFSFIPLFSQLGNNDVVIRSSFEDKADSVITHTVYYMPNADIYTRRAWDLDAQYTDLLNYIGMRKGTIYMGVGKIERIISTAPQMAIMNIGSESFEKLVMIENSSKTTWEVGETYKVFGDAYGLYDTMPRLTVRYTYLAE